MISEINFQQLRFGHIHIVVAEGFNREILKAPSIIPQFDCKFRITRKTVFAGLPFRLSKGSMTAAPPFGLILPPRPVFTNPIIVSETQYAFTFSSLPSFSHLVVFLLPGTTLPEGTLAGVYIQVPGQALSEFKLLGALASGKQSAIFQVSDPSPASHGTNNGLVDLVEDEMIDAESISKTTNNSATGVTAGEFTVGISIEPAATIESQLQSIEASKLVSSTALVSAGSQQQSRTPLATKALAQRIIKNAFNFLASFAGATNEGGQEVVPLKSFQDWWTKFERRIEIDQGFLEREDDN